MVLEASVGNQATATCRVCGEPLEVVCDFGLQPLGNGFLSPENFDNEHYFRMRAAFSEKSRMLQLIEQPDPEKMFHEDYAFFSSTSTYMQRHFSEFADSVLSSTYLDEKPFVVELGCNDGILLKHFATKGIRHLGIEPSKNVADVANRNGVQTISKFFTHDLAKEIVNSNGKADAFLAANVMCHIPDIISVVKGIKELLKETGVAIFEDPYLGDVVEKTSYDQLYDEHVYLFSALSIEYLFSLVDMEIINLEHQTTHGGSMRYFIANKGVYQVNKSVHTIINHEKSLNLDKIDSLVGFTNKIKKSRFQLLELLRKLKAEGKKVVGYAATSKSTTILNYCGIGPDLISDIYDTTPLKQGKFSPGMHIPIRPYDEFKDCGADYAFLFAWNHEHEILSKESEFMKRGGKWILHVPEVRIK